MTADSLATWLTSLLLMPSASATAMPFELSSGSLRNAGAVKSWLISLRPLSECWPTEICSWPGMHRQQSAHPVGEAPLSRASGRCGATRCGLRFGAVLTCVAYSVRPVKARPPTRLPSTVGISFQMK